MFDIRDSDSGTGAVLGGGGGRGEGGIAFRFQAENGCRVTAHDVCLVRVAAAAVVPASI